MTLIELGLLAFIVIGIIVSIYVLRRSEQYIADKGPEEEFHREHEQEEEGRWIAEVNEEIGPRMLARIAKRTGLKPKDL